MLASFPELPSTHNEAGFDRWHGDACASLCSLYSQNCFTEFTIGQSQKWINMALKYDYVLGEDRVGGFADLYRFCHLPIDSIILD
jgi:hypothetical protein